MVRIQTPLPECLIKCQHANMTACSSRFSCIYIGLLFMSMYSWMHAVCLDVRGNGQGRGPSGGVGRASSQICLPSERGGKGLLREGCSLTRADSKCKRMNTNDRHDMGETWGGGVRVWGWGGVVCGWLGAGGRRIRIASEIAHGCKTMVFPGGVNPNCVSTPCTYW